MIANHKANHKKNLERLMVSNSVYSDLVNWSWNISDELSEVKIHLTDKSTTIKALDSVFKAAKKLQALSSSIVEFLQNYSLEN